MRFELIDKVIERTETGLTAIKQVSAAEEYLQDHFPTFPVLPGVFMLESMVQAARAFVDTRAGQSGSSRVVLGRVKSLKYGHFVSPGDTMRVTVTCMDPSAETPEFKGLVTVSGPYMPDGTRSPDESTAASGRFLLRPIFGVDAPGAVASERLVGTPA